MDVKALSDFQLYALIHNPNLNKRIQSLAQHAFEHRNLNEEQIKQFELDLKCIAYTQKQQHLSKNIKTLLLLFPFVLIVHILYPSQYLAYGHRLKWNEYWKYVQFGFLLWMACFFIIALIATN